jgi:UDP-N-acetylmuramoyl-tripeptide--D-alanyl-D-alanine ligase
LDINRFYKLFINQEFRFSTDSRNIDEGCIFFALKGAHFNGNEYAAQAIEAGAAFAVIDEGEAADEKIIKVENVLQYFQKLAQFHRNCFDLPLIGIAGSNGKTTCKNLIYSVLQKKFSCHCTSGNFNNHIGVPITLLKMPVNTEIAIIELGTNSPGEIEELCAIAAPNFGLITNIGKEHLEGFGTLEAVAREESEIYLHLMKNGGTAFINENDDCLLRMSRNLDQKLYYSQNQVEIQSLVPEIKFSYENVEFSSVLMGD